MTTMAQSALTDLHGIIVERLTRKGQDYLINSWRLYGEIEDLLKLQKKAVVVEIRRRMICLVVFEDGSAWLQEAGELAQDLPANRILFSSENPLADAIAYGGDMASATAGLTRDVRGKGGLRALRKAGRKSRFEAQLDEALAHLREPLVTALKDTGSWSADQAEDLEQLVVLALRSGTPLPQTVYVTLWSAHDGDPAHLSIEDASLPGWRTALRRTTRILETFHDLHALGGVSFEYNDGASTRMSGFDPSARAIFTIETPPASSHQRIEALATLRQRLLQHGLNPAAADNLLSNSSERAAR